MEYTKGNWVIRFPLEGEPYDIGAKVIQKDYTSDTHIAFVGGANESEANAHLIAQSPRMAEWLERLVKQDGWVYQKDLDEAKEILAKAEGGSNE